MITLKCIWDVEEDEKLTEEYREICKSLKERNLVNKNDLFEDYHIEHGYAKCTHTGKLKDGVELTELELSMICDGGFSHFGGSSVIRSNRSFEVVIYTD